MATKKTQTKRKPGRPRKTETKVEQVEIPVIKKEKKPLSKAGAICVLIIAIVLFLFALTKVGGFGIIASNILSLFFGKLYFFVGLTLLFFLIKELMYKTIEEFPSNVYIGIVILNIAVMILGAVICYNDRTNVDFSVFKEIFLELKNITSITCDFGGGLIGTFFYVLLRMLFDTSGTIFALVIIFIISAILIIPLTYFKKAALAGKNVAINTASSIEEAKAVKDEKRKKELRRLKEIEREKAYSTLQEDEVIRPTKSNFNIIDETDKVEEVKNISKFSKDYFLEADGISMNKVEDALKDYKEQPKVKETHKPEAIKNVQVTLEEANSPRLSANPRVLGKADEFKGYKLPKLNSGLLMSPSSSKSDKNLLNAKEKGKKLIEILANFKIKATLVDYHIGPSVTKFEIKPDTSVNVNRITAIVDNIKMELAAKEIRIEAPIPGKNTVGVEIPNTDKVMVRMSELITKIPPKQKDAKLLFALGKDLMGTPVFCDISKMPHLLIGGATGSGKSVCINTLITSLLLRTKPNELKLVLVDPKKVEFTPYHDVPHLLWPVITDAKMASLMLKKIIVMMEERFDVFAKAAVRNIADYNHKVDLHNDNLKEGEEPMNRLPFIVVIIDELADLMNVASKDVQTSIQRITQLARASGIHLIVATQRPSTDVITGLIKSNIPSRIAFAVSSGINSRTILEQTGAENLLGYGDMLYLPQGENTPIRIQGCYVDDEEIENITNFCKSQAKPNYDDTYFALENNSSEGGSNASSGEDDDLYNDVVDFIATTKRASTSSLQRRFGIGYNRAARLIDTLEENGLVGPSNGSKPREVYIRNKDEK